MYRTFLTREVVPVARGRYADAVLQVPTTLAIGAHDLITRGIAPGPVEGQPNLTVEVVPGAAHWAPEQQPQAVIDWCLRGPTSARGPRIAGRGPRAAGRAGRLTGPPRRAARPAPDRSTPGSR